MSARKEGTHEMIQGWREFQAAGTLRLNALALEPRIMFDGAAVDAAQDAAAQAPTPAPEAPEASAPALVEVAFVDSNVQDYQSLVAGMRDGVEVHVLDSNQDGLTQISQILNGRSNIDAIHIVSHGAEGQVELGSLALSLSNLDPRGAELQQIGGSLSPNGDILLYGCDVANGAIGNVFVERLGLITGADIAASTDATGTPGNWALEKTTGSIESGIVVTASTQISYGYDLAFPFQLTGNYDLESIRIAVDSSGNVYTTGYFYNTVDFDPGAGTTNLTSAGGADIFIQKLDSSGNLVWAKGMGSTSDDYGSGIAVDGSGNVTTTGTFGGTVDFDAGAGTTNLTSAGDSDAFLLKLDSEGALIWVRGIGGSGSDRGTDVAIDASGNVYTTGWFSNTCDFDPGTGVTNLTSIGLVDSFVLKLDSSGSYVWAKGFGGSGNDDASGIAVDESGNVYTSGHFFNTVDFDPGLGTTNLNVSSGSTFVQKLDSDGALVWAKNMAGSGSQPSDIAVDSTGSVYTTGYFQGISDFDPDGGTVNLTASGDSAFICKLDSSGSFAWAKQIDQSYGHGIAIDGSNNVYTVGMFGYFQATVDFDPGPGTSNLTRVGQYDAFVQKLTSSGSFIWAKQMGGSFSEDGSSIAIDGSGNICIAGRFRGSGDYDPGAGTSNLTGNSNYFSLFMQKLLPYGTMGIGTPSVGSPTLNEDADSSAIAITRNSYDGSEVTHYKITGISGGALFSDSGFTSQINNGDFIASAGAATNVYFRPTANSTTAGSFTAQASTSNADAGLGGSTAASTVTVTAIADTPSVTNATTNEDTQSSSGLVLNRNAADGAEVTHFKITGITGGTLYKNDGTTAISNGTFITFAEGNAGLKFTPTANSTSNGSFTAQASTSGVDGGLGGSTVASTITVTAIADTPSITNATTNEDTQSSSGLVLSRNAADSTEVTHFKITGITGGTLYKNDGTTAISNGDFITYAEGNAGLKFTPSANSTSNGSFTAQASTSGIDGGLGGSTTTATITVNAVADTPSITNATTNEDTQSSSGLVLSRNAVDGAEVTHFKITGITGGTLYKNDGTTAISNGTFITYAEGNAGLKFTPNANSTSNGSFTAQASTSGVDGGLGGSTTTATVTVNPVADTPSITNATTNEDTQTSSGLVLSRNAADGAEVTHFKIAGITGGTLYKNDGTTAISNGDFITYAEGNAGLKFTPSANTSGGATFQVQGATDGSGTGLSNASTATVTVNPVADTPSITNALTNLGVQSTSGLVLSRSAADSTEVTHFKITGITNGTLYKNDGATQIANNSFITYAEGHAGLKFTPSGASNGSFDAQASLAANDGGLGGSTTSATVTINHAPTVANAIPDQTAPAGGAFTYQVAANAFNDADAGDTLTYSATKADGSPLPGWLNFTAGTRTFSGTPVVQGLVSVKVTATDGGSLATNDTFDITVNPPPAPAATNTVNAGTVMAATQAPVFHAPMSSNSGNGPGGDGPGANMGGPGSGAGNFAPLGGSSSTGPIAGGFGSFSAPSTSASLAAPPATITGSFAMGNEAPSGVMGAVAKSISAPSSGSSGGPSVFSPGSGGGNGGTGGGGGSSFSAPSPMNGGGFGGSSFSGGLLSGAGGFGGVPSLFSAGSLGGGTGGGEGGPLAERGAQPTPSAGVGTGPGPQAMQTPSGPISFMNQLQSMAFAHEADTAALLAAVASLDAQSFAQEQTL
jgi:co-chaperonin GroES (HSP10)